ncbi:gluconokinase [Neolewinella agarilytica]|uniref:Gluconate kinase, FGGY family n=1 Tax=Neolewinella agarilytica TaxID=478744 RepID=A0A1H9AXT3_9BACT|nr:FGGY family carbohydrate kinase [Neolewinella agarilytica]SEP80788.1 gluconate kinase, FGGY family [Neolewinella agarilytica]
MTYHIGLDIGTTSTKACAFDPAGKLLATEERPYPLLHPEPGAAVQEPMVILEAAENALADLVSSVGEKPAAIGLSCPMHSVILCDAYETPIDHVITWADTRAQAVMDDFSKAEREELLRLTGTPVHPMSPMVKLRWLLKDNPGWKEEAVFCYDLKSFLTKYWTNTAVIDQQLASASGLYDAPAGQWSARALAMAAGDEETFPFHLPPVQSAKQCLEWADHIAKRLGVEGVPLFLGGSDGVLANLGSGILAPGEVAITVGTSGAVRTTHRQSRIDPVHGLFNYQLYDDYYVVGGATNNGGKALAYWQNLLSAHFSDVGTMIDAALTVSAEESPVFLPYLYGERAPVWDAAATAELTGLAGHHDHRHLARAVLEGVTNNLVAILRQLEAATCPAQRLHASGGFTKSPEWLDLLARRADCELVLADAAQASAYGAAIIAREACTRGFSRRV